jgi:hypothetical protein
LDLLCWSLQGRGIQREQYSITIVPMQKNLHCKLSHTLLEQCTLSCTPLFFRYSFHLEVSYLLTDLQAHWGVLEINLWFGCWAGHKI